MIAIFPQQRSVDKWGSGAFGAMRDGGKRLHEEVNAFVEPGTPILCDVYGAVEKIGYVYSPDKKDRANYRIIDVRHRVGLLRYFYVSPWAEVGEPLVPGYLLSYAQSLQPIYPGIKDHIHFAAQVKGKYVDPLDWLKRNAK